MASVILAFNSSRPKSEASIPISSNQSFRHTSFARPGLLSPITCSPSYPLPFSQSMAMWPFWGPAPFWGSEPFSGPGSAVSARWLIHILDRASSIDVSLAPSNTGVATLKPRAWAARPRWVSRICPRFILEGTPMGFNTMSIGVPFGRKGISSSGRITAMTPLLPWRPAILSPSAILRVWATQTRTSWFTPGESSSLSSLVNFLTSITLPCSPWGTRRQVSLTSRAFSPKIARSSFSSAVSSVSPLGVILPTRISPGPTTAPILMIPSSSRSARLSSPTFGISWVISSGPSFVSRASTSCFSI